MVKQNRDLYRKALKLAVPIMIQNGITNMVGLVDNVMVGSLGTESMTAVSIVSQLIFVYNLSIFGGLSGPGIYGAQFYGKGNKEGLKHTFHIKMMICLFCLVAGLTIFLTKGEDLIGLYLKGEGTALDVTLTLQLAKQYLAVMLWNLFPFIVTQLYASSLRETGESVIPMIAGIFSVVIDIVLNYTLIYGKFGMPALGVRGAAIATVTARIVEVSIIIIWVHSKKDRFDFLVGIYKTILVPKDLAGTIIKKGLPIFVNEFLWSGGIAVLTQCYSIRGLEIIAGLNISNAICNLLNVVFVALGNAVGVLIGHTLGEANYEKAKKDSAALMRFSATLCIGLALILILLSGGFPKLYDTSEEVRKIGKNFIIITACFFPIQGLLNALYFTLRSGGKTFITFLFDSVFSWVVSVPICYILCFHTTLPIYGVYVLVQSCDIIKVFIGLILIKKGVWITNLVE